MDGFEQSGLEKETIDPHHICYQNAVPLKEKENAFRKKL